LIEEEARQTNERRWKEEEEALRWKGYKIEQGRLSMHSEASIRFYKEVLQAGSTVKVVVLKSKLER
jgi:hypothetical protein